MRRPMIMVLAALALVCLAAAGARSWAEARPAAAGHPRIFLDQGTLKTLRARARAETPEWTALKAGCDRYLGGRVEWPDGNDYPDEGGIGEHYQGGGYFAAVLNLGLCYETALALDRKTAAAYGEKGADVLEKMSAPSGPHAVNPLRDDGYGVRFYPLGMAIGFDWLYPALPAALRERVATAIDRWLSAYEAGGFGREFPQGNYFAGYYAAKGIAALATEGDASNAPAMWEDWLGRVHGQMVQPYYAANLSGGGWPEGWNYGPLATLNQSWPALAALTAKGLDLLRDPQAPYVFPLNAPRFLVHFTWPSLRTMEDSGAQYNGDNPAATSAWLVTAEAGLLERFGSPFAPWFHSYARAVRAAQAGDAGGDEPDQALWEDFLFWNDRAPERDYRKLPRSYLARGVEMAAVRSDWSATAVWGAFTAGPYVDYKGSEEEFFDAGSLVVVNGRRQLLVNATGALLRNTPGTDDGGLFEDRIFDNLHGDSANRDLFNVFFVDRPPGGQGEYLRSDGARTSVARFEDGRSYVAMRGSFLEDEYPHEGETEKTIVSWTREVVYLRPELFVVYDRTQVTDPGLDQRLAFHVAARPVAAGPGRFHVGSGKAYAGTVAAVLPAGRRVSVVDVFGSHKVYRLEVRPGSAGESQRWLTVVDAAGSAESAAAAAALDVREGDALGVHLRSGSATFAVVVGAGEAIPGDLRYAVPGGATTHIVTDLAPGAGFTVSIERSGDVRIVSIRPGGSSKSSAAGVLVFTS